MNTPRDKDGLFYEDEPDISPEDQEKIKEWFEKPLKKIKKGGTMIIVCTPRRDKKLDT